MARRTVGLEDLILPVCASAGVVAAAGFLAWTLYTRFYVPVPPNRALVLFGHRASAPRSEADRHTMRSESEVRRPRIVVGGSAFLAPWNRGVGHLSLEPIAVDLTVRSMHAVSGGRASGWETRVHVQFKIPADPGLLATASENLLGKSDEELRTLVRHAVEGVVPAVLARLRPEPGEPDWERLASEIQASVAPDLIALGLVVRTLSVTELHQISPTDPSRSIAPAPAWSGSPVADPSNLSPRLANFDVRLARAERSLGIMGAEVVRMVRATTPSLEVATPGSIFDSPLGFGDPEATFAPESPVDSPHDSMGGERLPQSGRRFKMGVDGELEARPLLDTEP
jgi:hypothetical protein